MCRPGCGVMAFFLMLYCFIDMPSVLELVNDLCSGPRGDFLFVEIFHVTSVIFFFIIIFWPGGIACCFKR